MFRYGKKLDRYPNDKRARSNRGRARTSATAFDRRHANRGYRRSQLQIAEIRADKKCARLVARLAIEDELFDLDLAKCDPEIWLHGTDLTTFEDTATKQRRGYPGITADPYEHVPDVFDWDWEYQDDLHQNAEDEFCYLHAGDYESDGGDWNSARDPYPEPTDTAWRDMWVEGRAHDSEGRDLSDPMDACWYCDDYDTYDYYDYLVDLDNPLLEHGASALPAINEAAEERDRERHRAGERYFKQTGRTVLKSTKQQRRESAVA